MIVAGLLFVPLIWSKGNEVMESLLVDPQLLTVHDTPRSLKDISFTGPEAIPASLSMFLGNFVLLNIWATWCPPCRKEIPSLDALQRALSDLKDFLIVPLSVDRANFAQVEAFYRTVGVRSLRLYQGDEAHIVDSLYIGGLPTTILLNRRGQEIARLVGPTQWDSAAVIHQIRTLVSTH